MKKSRKITATLVASTLPVVLCVLLLFSAFGQIEEAAEARRHTTSVINCMDELQSALRDSETGERSYLLTSDELFLEPFQAVRNSFPGRLEKLRRLTTTSSAVKHLDKVEPLITAQLAEMSRAIELRRRNDMTIIQADVSNIQSKRLMDLIRAEMDSFTRIEKSLLERNETDFTSNMRYLFVVIVIAGFMTLAFGLAFAYLVYRDSQQKLENRLHVETQQLLETQEDTNKQLQQAYLTLQISEEKLSVTLNSIGDAVIATDAGGRVTLLNPLAEKLTGWSQAEALGRPAEEILRLVNQVTRLPSVVPIMKTLTHGTTQGLASHPVLISRNGSERPIADSCAPIRDHEGQVIGAVLVFRDISIQMEIENGLEKNRRELAAVKISQDEAREYSESIINTVREPLIVLDQDLRVVAANRSFYEGFKVNPGATVKQLIYDL
ncbi:MAG: CHASE3 domain-containing protein, partial [Candidatus Wallbacteria bacterium]|nr:CHASE3 domain-containing protein [Candidatus Wallbacteria bacterium]